MVTRMSQKCLVKESNPLCLALTDGRLTYLLPLQTVNAADKARAKLGKESFFARAAAVVEQEKKRVAVCSEALRKMKEKK
jgi:hypothetical protein